MGVHERSDVGLAVSPRTSSSHPSLHRQPLFAVIERLLPRASSVQEKGNCPNLCSLQMASRQV